MTTTVYVRTIVDIRVHQLEQSEVEPMFWFVRLGFGDFHQDKERARKQERAKILCFDGAKPRHVGAAIMDDVQRAGQVTGGQRG